MICSTIINKDFQGVMAALETCEMAEIRLDRCDLTAKEIDELFTAGCCGGCGHCGPVCSRCRGDDGIDLYWVVSALRA